MGVLYHTSEASTAHPALTLASRPSAGKEFSSHDWLLNLNHSLLLQSRPLINSIHSPARSKNEEVERAETSEGNNHIQLHNLSWATISFPISPWVMMHQDSHSPVMHLPSQRFFCSEPHCQPLFPVGEKLSPREDPKKQAKPRVYVVRPEGFLLS